MKRRGTLLAASALLLAGCAGIQGPPQVINARGVLPQTQGGSLEARFERAAVAALAAGANSQAQTDFVRSGMLLVYARCNDFFQRAGRNQSRSRVTRDLVAPVLNLLTGLLALHDFGDDSDTEQDILEALTLSSTFATSALDVHDRHFLFGADNVDSVREMTLNTLVVQSRASLNPAPATFEDAVRRLIDNQAICTPPHILFLARQAIANSAPRAFDENGTDISRGTAASQGSGATQPNGAPVTTVQTQQTGVTSTTQQDGRVTARIPQ